MPILVAVVGGRGRGDGRQGDGSPGGRPNVECPLCGKLGHTVLKCYKRFDANFTGPYPKEKNAAAVTASYGIDTNWYTDSGASDHITGELDKLTIRDRYTGGDQVHTASGSGMEISQIGHSVVHTPSKKSSIA